MVFECYNGSIVDLMLYDKEIYMCCTNSNKIATKVAWAVFVGVLILEMLSMFGILK